MKKIITAINNPKLNQELKKEKKFEIIGKDIQYKEAILELLEKNKNIDLIIISEKIPGEIKLEKLIKKIKLINEKIKIIFILEKENIDLEKILIKNNIIDIYYNNKINLNELIKIINKKEINMEEEIIKLKKIIEEKNNNSNKRNQKENKNKKIFIKKNLEKIKNKIIVKVISKIKKEKKVNSTNNMSTKIITFSGNYKSGKSTLALIISQYLAQRNYKVLLIDGDLEKQDLSTILKKEKNKDNKKRNNKIEKRMSKFKNKYLNKNKINKNKINKNKINKNKINKNEINKNEINKNEINNNKINKNKINKNEINKNKINNNKINKNKLIKKIKLINKKNKIKLINKNKICNYKIKNRFNSSKIKINKNLYFFNELNYLLKNNLIKKEKKFKKIISTFFKIVKPNYNFIIIELSKNNLESINKKILENSNINFVVMEPNLLGVKEAQKILTIYLSEWKISSKSLQLILNKKNFNSINKNLISKYLSSKNKIFEIKENKFYKILINNYLKKIFLLKNKKIKKEINKIINRII